MTEEEVRQKAEEHWEFLEPLLLPHYLPIELAVMKYLYITAMVHGIKHGREMAE